MRSTFKIAAITLSLIGLTPVTTSVQAATATTTLGVSATVVSTCTAASTPVAFGNYSLAAKDGTGAITVTCTSDVLAYNVALGAGSGTGATITSRKLTLDASNSLDYGLYSDSNRTLNWGDTTLAGAVLSTFGTGAGTTKTFTVYGQIPANQAVSAGTYTDTVAVTVNY